MGPAGFFEDRMARSWSMKQMFSRTLTSFVHSVAVEEEREGLNEYIHSLNYIKSLTPHGVGLFCLSPIRGFNYLGERRRIVTDSLRR